MELVERALLRRFARSAVPLAVLPEARRVIPCGTAFSITRATLEKWLEGATS